MIIKKFEIFLSGYSNGAKRPQTFKQGLEKVSGWMCARACVLTSKKSNILISKIN